MPRATNFQVSNRERELHPLLQSVDQKVEQWARQSKDGALVWDVATTHLHGMWSAWDIACHSERWWTPDGLLDDLEALAIAVNDEGVSESITAAQAALRGYSEPHDCWNAID